LPAKQPGEYRFFRVTIPQVSVEDPENVGCGHKYKLINEWTLRKILYTNFIAKNNSTQGYFEVKKIFASF
jgi:hypothetical protein